MAGDGWSKMIGPAILETRPVGMVVLSDPRRYIKTALGEHLSTNAEDAGSIPAASTINPQVCVITGSRRHLSRRISYLNKKGVIDD
jgi:malonyl CoA-acyl carrier protein transacylase